MGVSEFSIRMERTSWKSQDLIYEEPGYAATIYLEMSGVREFDWVGAWQDLETWEVPKGEPIPEPKRTQILLRVAEWSARERLRIDIGPAIDPEEFFAQYRDKGWTVTRNSDGSTTVSPPGHKQ